MVEIIKTCFTKVYASAGDAGPFPFARSDNSCTAGIPRNEEAHNVERGKVRATELLL
jgi:hypothetical protein